MIGFKSESCHLGITPGLEYLNGQKEIRQGGGARKRRVPNLYLNELCYFLNMVFLQYFFSSGVWLLELSFLAILELNWWKNTFVKNT